MVTKKTAASRPPNEYKRRRTPGVFDNIKTSLGKSVLGFNEETQRRFRSSNFMEDIQGLQDPMGTVVLLPVPKFVRHTQPTPVIESAKLPPAAGTTPMRNSLPQLFKRQDRFQRDQI